MTRIILVLVATVGLMSACSSTTPAPKTVIAKKTPVQKTPICKAVYQKKGRHCVVIVARCRFDSTKPRATTVTIAVTDTEGEGERAADESVRILIKYFRGRPEMKLLATRTIKGVPIYLFVVTGIIPRLPQP